MKQTTPVAKKRTVRPPLFRFLINLGKVLLIGFVLVIQIFSSIVLTIISLQLVEYRAITTYFDQHNTLPGNIDNIQQLHLVFFDSLTDNYAEFAAWNTYTRGQEGADVLSLADSTSLFYQPNPYNPYLTSHPDTNEFSNFVFDVHLNIYTSNGGGGIIFLGSDYRTGYIFYITEKGTYVFGFFDDKGNLQTTESSSKFIHTAPGADNSITAVALNNQIKLYVNGNLIKNYHNDKYDSGSIGFFVSHSNVIYTDARLWTVG